MGNRYANAAYTAAIGEYRNFRIISPSSKIFLLKPNVWSQSCVAHLAYETL